MHKASSPADGVTLAYVATTHAVLTGVALHHGYYQQEGLEVTPRVHSFGKAALEDMLEGNADFATVADPPDHDGSHGRRADMCDCDNSDLQQGQCHCHDKR